MTEQKRKVETYKDPWYQTGTAWLCYIILGFVIYVCLFFVIPWYMVYGPTKANRYRDHILSQPRHSAPDDTAVKYVGRDRLRQQLRDPDSLQIIEERVVNHGGQTQYEVRYRAKNGFGGYVEETYRTQ